MDSPTATKFPVKHRVLCYSDGLLYRAEILNIRKNDGSTTVEYFIRYVGWSSTHDEWVSEDRLLEINQDNLTKQRSLLKERHGKTPDHGTARSTGMKYSVGEKVLCYHHSMLYEAKILNVQISKDDGEPRYFVHFQGWNSRYDEWVKDNRVLEFSPENVQKQLELNCVSVGAKRQPCKTRAINSTTGSNHNRMTADKEIVEMAKANSARNAMGSKPEMRATSEKVEAGKKQMSELSSYQLICSCLNVAINISMDNQKSHGSIVKIEAIKQLCGPDVADDPFFKLCQKECIAQFFHEQEKGIVEKLPMLVTQRTVADDWVVHRCLLCDVDAFATRVNSSRRIVLANMNVFLPARNRCFQRDADKIEQIRKSRNYSPAFDVILPENCSTSENNANIDRSSCEIGIRFSNNASAVSLPKDLAQCIKERTAQYVSKEKDAMEKRIWTAIRDENILLQLAAENYPAAVESDGDRLLNASFTPEAPTDLGHMERGKRANQDGPVTNAKKSRDDHCVIQSAAFVTGGVNDPSQHTAAESNTQCLTIIKSEDNKQALCFEGSQ